MDTLRTCAVVASLIAVSCARPSSVAPAPAAKDADAVADLVARVDDAARLVSSKGEAAFAELRTPGSRWRRGQDYVFVLDTNGDMLVHPDPALEGKNELDLKDIDGRPIVRGIIDAAAGTPGKSAGWYHYQWPVPGGMIARWKSTYARLVTPTSGARYVVASGLYDDRMDRTFVVDLVEQASAEVESRGRAAFPLFHDRKGPFLVKDAYVFVIDRRGVDLVNPAFRNLEGQNLLEQKDTNGKLFIQEMLRVAETKGSGWVDYMWPKPGEAAPTRKSAFVRRTALEGDWVVVGCGVYLADAPKAAPDPDKPTASELMSLVRDGAALLERDGEQAYSELRTKGSRWFRDDLYFFVWALDGTRTFFAPDPSAEGQNMTGLEDVLGRSVGRMILAAAESPAGEGWVHYMWPLPGGIFPTWKSTFVKRVALPSGEPRLIGCGVYDMRLDKVMVEDQVSRAAALVAARGRSAFPLLRDKTGPFVFMDSYVFVDSVDGTELVNPAQPSVEGKNLIRERDLKGKLLVLDYIDAALKNGSAWVSYYWYKPGENSASLKHSYVQKVQAGPETFVVGSGFYPEESEEAVLPEVPAAAPRQASRVEGAVTVASASSTDATEGAMERGQAVLIRKGERLLRRVPGNQVEYGQLTPKGVESLEMLTLSAGPGESTGPEALQHAGDEQLLLLSGTVELEVEGEEFELGPGDSLFIPRGSRHRFTNTGAERAEAIMAISPRGL